MSSLNTRIEALDKLGHKLTVGSDAQEEAIARANSVNKWFTPEYIKEAIYGIANNYLSRKNLESWTSKYSFGNIESKKVGLILAGNIPLVGFHDILSVYISGHHGLLKNSSKDDVLTKYVVNELKSIDPTAKLEFVDRLTGYDAVIATGSNNSSRYFEDYFKHVPNIIRKNRNGVAILTGKESGTDFIGLGKDIFTYFGLGCRNVSKIYVPKDYNFSPLIESLHDNYKEVILHHKYKNNFDFNHALYMLNKEEFLMSGSLMLVKSDKIVSRISSVHYAYYDDLNKLCEELSHQSESIQCIVAKEGLPIPTFEFGYAQQPSLNDYADGVDTMAFLTEKI